MNNQVIRVPASLLLDRYLSPTAKVVCMALRHGPTSTPGQLEAATGLSRHTVLKGLRRARELPRVPQGHQVQVPAALLAERAVAAQAKVLFGLLQLLPGCGEKTGQFTYSALSAATGLDRNTLRRSLGELRDSGWLQVTQSNRLSPLRFSAGTPELRRCQAAAKLAERRIQRARFKGEAIMQEYLSLLIDSEQFADNARPGFLVNPQTGERLELDRFYQPNLAFELNGAQHYRQTGLYTQAEAEAQHFRDLIKGGLCLYEGIQLIIVHPEDLSLQGMIRKVGSSAPRRDLAGQEPLIEVLETASIAYVAAARKAGEGR